MYHTYKLYLCIYPHNTVVCHTMGILPKLLTYLDGSVTCRYRYIGNIIPYHMISVFKLEPQHKQTVCTANIAGTFTHFGINLDLVYLHPLYKLFNGKCAVREKFDSYDGNGIETISYLINSSRTPRVGTPFCEQKSLCIEEYHLFVIAPMPLTHIILGRSLIQNWPTHHYICRLFL
jgi:hypothetical protein